MADYTETMKAVALAMAIASSKRDEPKTWDDIENPQEKTPFQYWCDLALEALNTVSVCHDGIGDVLFGKATIVPTTPTDRQLLAMETGSSMAAVYELALAHSPFKGK